MSLKRDKLYHYIKYAWKPFLAVELSSFFYAVAMVLWSLFMYQLTQDATELRTSRFLFLAVYALGFVIGVAILQYAVSAADAVFTRKYKEKLYNDVFRSIFYQNVHAFNLVNSAEYISLINNDLKQIDEQYFQSITSIISQALLTLVSSAALLIYDWRLGIVALLLSSLPFIQTVVCGKGIAKAQTQFLKLTADYLARIKDYFNAYEFLHSSGARGRIVKRHRESNHALRVSEQKYMERRAFARALAVMFMYLDGAIFLLAAGFLVARGHIVIGVMIGAMQISNYVSAPIHSITQLATQLRSILPVANKIEKLLSVPVPGDEEEKLTPVELLPIVYSDYSVGYSEDAHALHSIGLRVEKGKKYAIVGASGCGKSTLLKSILGFFPVNQSSGSIEYADAAASGLDPRQLYAQIAYIEQNVILLEGSLRENLTLYNQYPEQEIVSALLNAGGEKWITGGRIAEMHIQEMGRNLSGGEIQRIAIARALLQRKKIILCDEITANIDLKTADDIYSALLAQPDITLLVISHQLSRSYLALFDEIIYMHRGEVLAQGPFQTLMQNNTSFYYYFMYSGGNEG